MFALVSCEEKVEEKKMTLVVASQNVKFKMTGVGYLTIDWGDGTKEQFTLSKNKTEYYHEYQSGERHTIVLNGWISTLSAGRFPIDDNTTFNQIISFDAGNNSSLKYLDCSENIITDLNISKCTELTELYCWNNQLTNLDVNNSKKLIILKCFDNQLLSLDVAKNIELTEMSCSKNKIRDLDISRNINLMELYCNDNLLTNLDASSNDTIKRLFCHDNQLSAYAINNLFYSLHSKLIPEGKTVSIYGNPGANYCNKGIAKEKGWSVY